MDILDGIRIVSFNHFFMGPVGIQLLADLGADVIAVEPTGGAFQRHWGGANTSVDGQAMLFLLGNRKKRSLAPRFGRSAPGPGRLRAGRFRPPARAPW